MSDGSLFKFRHENKGKVHYGKCNGFWNGGRSVASNGYVLIRVGTDHHLADVRGYAYEHRLVLEKKLGRRLRKGEQAHHINGNKQDNRPENLEAMESRSHHAVAHRTDKNKNKLRMPGEENPILLCRCGCGRTFNKFDKAGRPRMYISGHNPRGRFGKHV